MTAGSGKMAQQLRASTSLSENPGSVPSTCVEQFIVAYNSSSRMVNVLYLHRLHSYVQAHSLPTHTNTHMRAHAHTN